MGTSRTTTYRVEYLTDKDGNLIQTMCWKGAATQRKLADWLAVYNASFQPCGCNAHCGPLVITSARVVHQESGRVVARATR